MVSFIRYIIKIISIDNLSDYYIICSILCGTSFLLFSGVKSGQVLLTADFEAEDGNIGFNPVKAGSAGRKESGKLGSGADDDRKKTGRSDNEFPVLHVELIKGRNLIKSDLIGKSDPYAVLKYGDQSDKTKVVKNNLNPQWDHASDFDMDLGDNENLM